MNAIYTRRSVRQYSDKEVSLETLDKLVRAGMQAPSAKNQQPWRILVTKDKEKLQKLSGMSKMLESAAACIILFYSEDVSTLEMVGCDMGACTQNILLECASLGLGACWIGIPQRPNRIQIIMDTFNVPKGFVPYSVISLGYPQDTNANHFVDRYDSSKVFYEGF